MTHKVGRPKNIFNDIWKYIDKSNDNQCWDWLGCIHNSGYGMFMVNYKPYLSHRLIYEMTYGNITDNLLVCHKCDNRKCCNPLHLFLGTAHDNTVDMVNKNRCNSPIGQRNGMNKLNNNEIKEIRLLYTSNNYTQKILSEIYSVSQSNISLIVNSKRWKHINNKITR